MKIIPPSHSLWAHIVHHLLSAEYQVNSSKTFSLLLSRFQFMEETIKFQKVTILLIEKMAKVCHVSGEQQERPEEGSAHIAVCPGISLVHKCFPSWTPNSALPSILYRQPCNPRMTNQKAWNLIGPTDWPRMSTWPKVSQLDSLVEIFFPTKVERENFHCYKYMYFLT